MAEEPRIQTSFRMKRSLKAKIDIAVKQQAAKEQRYISAGEWLERVVLAALGKAARGQ